MEGILDAPVLQHMRRLQAYVEQDPGNAPLLADAWHAAMQAGDAALAAGFARRARAAEPAFEALFEPKVPGFTKVPYNDLEALAEAVDEQTVAVMLEPVQGEAGVIPATLDYLQGAERLCRERGVLLILDEVQTGIGRCGTLLAEELYGIRADIITLGKGLGGGVPLAARSDRPLQCVSLLSPPTWCATCHDAIAGDLRCVGRPDQSQARARAVPPVPEAAAARKHADCRLFTHAVQRRGLAARAGKNHPPVRRRII